MLVESEKSDGTLLLRLGRGLYRLLVLLSLVLRSLGRPCRRCVPCSSPPAARPRRFPLCCPTLMTRWRVELVAAPTERGIPYHRDGKGTGGDVCRQPTGLRHTRTETTHDSGRLLPPWSLVFCVSIRVGRTRRRTRAPPFERASNNIDLCCCFFVFCGGVASWHKLK